ncbi:adenosylhomocysteinase [Candidatus Uhrbacteria bacterium]|nr:adenosylhomocysteinase [Candidatus Uhrbacteria bacterium]
MEQYKVKDISLAPQGKLQIELAERRMGALLEVRKEFEKEKPLAGLTIGMALHVTKETAVLVRTLRAGGAEVAITGCNPLSTQDDVAAALASEGVAVFAHKGETNAEYYDFLNKVIDFLKTRKQENKKTLITIDDGGDLVGEIHKKHAELIKNLIGGTEETTTGIIRLRAMEKDAALKYPVVAVNDNKTKHLVDNYYGTGQSTLDGITRATNILWAGKTVVVCGYGSCGKGVALRSRGMGANVIVCEVDAFRALQAVLDGLRVLPLLEAASLGDIFITVTGNRHVLAPEHFQKMKTGGVLANSGHFDAEIDLEGLNKMATGVRKVRPMLDEYAFTDGKVLFVAGEGRLVNLAAAEGHPSEVMSLSFCGQALACAWLVEKLGTLEPKVHVLPPEVDDRIAALQLEAMKVLKDELTGEQKKYLSSWQEGT